MTEWNKYELFVVGSLQKNSERLNNIEEILSEIRVDIGKLKVKSGLWGAAGGAIPFIILLAIEYLKR